MKSYWHDLTRRLKLTAKAAAYPQRLSVRRNKVDGAIASPHWEACYTCKKHGKNGCILSHITMSVYLGDWIICDDYLADNKPIQPIAMIAADLYVGGKDGIERSY